VAVLVVRPAVAGALRLLGGLHAGEAVLLRAGLGPGRLVAAVAEPEAAVSEQPFGGVRLRVGGHWGRTLVAQGRYEPPDAEGRRPDDRLVGMVDTPELAAEICRRWNA
jgi:hypothetical protein